ncbi:hypothetical protein [Aggregatibacter segnis]|uniref:hypothetical protein n=1 Tax=Aggregatibacter segnis TaxID=739 RepID=UPI000D686AD9|nr:hypothetical protein [Aggregatibacter segnis]
MKPTNPMAQLQQWKANNTKRLVSDGGVSVNGVHPNALKIELVKSAIKNCEIDCETAKRSKTQRTLDNTGFIKRNCETGCEFAKAHNANLHSVQKTQQEAQGGEKRKYQEKLFINPLVAEYSQLTRQFKLIHDSNRKCLEVYPDDFHHKLKMRGECVDLVERLKGGGKLFNDLAKGTNLNAEQTALLKDFNQASGYLIYKFSEVVAQIERLQDVILT